MIFNSTIKLFSLLILYFVASCSIAKSTDVTNVVQIESCKEEQYRREIRVGSVNVELKSLCDTNDILVLSIEEKPSYKLLSKFLYPYSFTFKLVEEIHGYKSHMAVIQLAPSEPEPTGSYYFAVVDLNEKSLVLDGYSDSEINVRDIDGDGIKEVIYGSNLSGVNPLDTMLDYIPYPRVLDWNCHGGLRLIGNQAYPELVESYQKSLRIYIQQLSKKGVNAPDSMGSNLIEELDFAKTMMNNIFSDKNINTQFMTSNAECKQLSK